MQISSKSRIHRNATEAQPVEHIFEVMRQVADRFEPEHARQALQRVCGAKHAIQEIGIHLRIAVETGSLVEQVGEIRQELVEDLFRLRNELPESLAF